MTTFPHHIALITGASAGIGAVYADRLAKRGYDLILVARRSDRLREVGADIARRTGRHVETIAADLADRSAVADIERTLRENDRISLLVNNAGLAALAPLLDSDVDLMSKIVAVNIDALVRLTYAVVPGFVARGKGTVINIGSVVGLWPERLNGVYAASKAFVLAFSQSLRNEVSDKGITVQAVLPGGTATDLWPNLGVPLSALPQESVMTAEALVDAALVGLDKGEFMTSPSLPDLAAWDAFDVSRLALSAQMSRSHPASRYT